MRVVSLVLSVLVAAAAAQDFPDDVGPYIVEGDPVVLLVAVPAGFVISPGGTNLVVQTAVPFAVVFSNTVTFLGTVTPTPALSNAVVALGFPTSLPPGSLVDWQVNNVTVGVGTNVAFNNATGIVWTASFSGGRVTFTPSIDASVVGTNGAPVTAFRNDAGYLTGASLTNATVVKVKASDQQTTNTTLVTDADLSFAVTSGEVWQITGFLRLHTDTATPDAVVAITGPGTPIAVAVTASFDWEGSAAARVQVIGAYGSGVGFNAGDPLDPGLARIEGVAWVGENAGTLSVQWAQRVEDTGDPLIVQQGSYLVAQRLSP